MSPLPQTGIRTLTTTDCSHSFQYSGSISNGGSKIDDVVGSLGLAVDLTLGKYQPVKEGYTFTGWYADKELTDKVTSVRLGSYSTVYAG